MFEIISIISGWALKIINQSGYLGIFLLSVLESAAVPIPSEIVLPFSGFLAVQGRFSFWLIVWLATLANLLGSIGIYFVGYRGARPLIKKFGKYILFSDHELERAERLFAHHGQKAIFISRLLPGVRTFISIIAGFSKMPFSIFVWYTILGSFIWNFGLALIGYKAGENWRVLEPYFRKFDFAIIVVILIFIIWYILRHLKHKHIIHG